MTDELKACPFCGNEAIYFENSVNKYFSRGVVRCIECNIGNVWVTIKSDAIKAWNSRVDIKKGEA